MLPAPALFRASSSENPQALSRSLFMALLTKQLLTPNLGPTSPLILTEPRAGQPFVPL